MTADQIPVDGRWTCPRCSCFIAESAIREWDEMDAGAYYGIAQRYEITCRKCGVLTDGDVLPPRWTPTRYADLNPSSAATKEPRP